MSVKAGQAHYVTASLQVVGLVALLLVPKGFQYQALERRRYGTDRDEVVLTWTPASHEAAKDRGWVNDQLDAIRCLDERWPLLLPRPHTLSPNLNRLVLGNRDNCLYHEIGGGYQDTRPGA
jgi:hypothetical protein